MLKRWGNSVGMRHPLMSGIWVDEYGIGEKYGKKTRGDMYPVWTKALKLLQANPAFQDRMYYAYIAAPRLLPYESYAQMAPFLRSMMDGGYVFAPECYLPESVRAWTSAGKYGRPEYQEFSPGWELATRQSFEAFVPGGAGRSRHYLVYVFGSRLGNGRYISGL